jgi:hypothetical protein
LLPQIEKEEKLKHGVTVDDNNGGVLKKLTHYMP